MSTSVSQARIKLISGPYAKRIGIVPLAAGLVVGWLFSIIWFATSCWLLAYSIWWAVLLCASTILFCVFLTLMSYRLIHDAFCDFSFEINDDEAVLFVKDRLRHKKSTQMVLLSDVKYAEYYPWCDVESLILHAPYADMEVPLWPLQGHGQDVVDFLSGHGVKVVNVQSEDKISE